jgi:hypothetical protein
MAAAAAAVATAAAGADNKYAKMEHGFEPRTPAHTGAHDLATDPT